MRYFDFITQEHSDLGLAISLAFLNFIFLLFCWHTVGVQSDESLNIYGALRIIEGDRIYRDFWVYYTPGIFFLSAAVMSALGTSLPALRLVLVAASAVAAALMYLLGRTFMGRVPSIVSALLFILIGVNLWPVAVQHWYSTISLILCTFLVARYLEDTTRLASLFCGGALAGVAFLLQQQKGGMLIVTILLFVLLFRLTRKQGSPPWAQAVPAGFVFALGVTAPLAPVIFYFWSSGTLGDAVSATIVFPLTHVTGGGGAGFLELYGSLTRPALLQLTQFFEPVWIGQAIAAATTFIINAAAPLSLAVALAWWLVEWFLGRKVNPAALLAFLVGFICLASSLQRPDFHHLLSNAAPSYLSIGYLIAALAGRSAATQTYRKRACAAAALILLFPPLLVAAGELHQASRIQKSWLGSRLGFLPLDRYESYNGLHSLIEYVRMNSGPDDNIFVVYASPFLYYLCERTNPTIYPVLPMSPCVSTGNVHLLDLSENAFFEAQTDDAISAVEAAGTLMVVLDPAAICLFSGNDEEVRRTNPLARYLNEQFHCVGNWGGFMVLRRNNSYST